jgi:thiol-disulfide isomerase/thioredoxin
MNFFEVFQLEKIHSSNFAEKIASTDQLCVVFFWGHDCPNCDIAKRVLVDRKIEVDSLQLKWFHANIYEDFELATQFGLFGIPVFMFFKNSKKLGKISPFPGFDPFYETITLLKTKINS